MSPTRLEIAEKKLEQIKNQVQSLRAAQNKRNRKNDTRRKIILGSALIAEAKKTPALREFIERQIATLNERDKAVFEGWTVDDN